MTIVLFPLVQILPRAFASSNTLVWTRHQILYGHWGGEREGYCFGYCILERRGKERKKGGCFVNSCRWREFKLELGYCPWHDFGLS